MFDLSRHHVFTEYTDPKSGVKSYALTERVATMPINNRIRMTNTTGTRLEPLMPKEFYGVSTTTVADGKVDVAITPVEPLLDKCHSNGTEVVFDGIKPHGPVDWVQSVQQMIQ